MMYYSNVKLMPLASLLFFSLLQATEPTNNTIGDLSIAILPVCTSTRPQKEHKKRVQSNAKHLDKKNVLNPTISLEKLNQEEEYILLEKENEIISPTPKEYTLATQASCFFYACFNLLKSYVNTKSQ